MEDVEDIAAHIARDSAVYAEAVVERILDLTHQLAEFPYAGRVVPERGEAQIRERFVYSYRVIYRISDEQVLILAVVHGKRLLQGL